ncbi:hypothetical protein Hanom_Chr04g00354461 [Helianthus anomalus]
MKTFYSSRPSTSCFITFCTIASKFCRWLSVSFCIAPSSAFFRHPLKSSYAFPVTSFSLLQHFL